MEPDTPGTPIVVERDLAVKPVVVRDLLALDRCLEDVANEPVIAVDTETTGLSPFDSRVRLVQLAIPGRQYVIDCDAVRVLADARFRALMEAEKPYKVLHHAKFDCRMFDHHAAGLRMGGVFDTLIASQLVEAGISPEGGHSLAGVARRHLGVELDKTEQASDWRGDLSERQIEYAALDAAVLLPLRERMRSELIRLGLTKVAKLEFDLVPVVARMENAGIYLDAQRWRALCQSLDEQHAAISDELQKAISAVSLQRSLFDVVSANLNSRSEMIEAFGRLGVEVQGIARRDLERFADNPVVAKYLEYIGVQKLIGTYGWSMLDWIDKHTGRIHPNFKQIGTPSGRFACDQPNVQQIPHTPEYRECIRAAPGRLLCIGDYSQIELRVLADFAEDPGMLLALESGDDLHMATAARMFDLPIDRVPSNLRAVGKTINFGLVYGIGARTLADRLKVTVDTAERFIDQYFAAYPRIRDYLRQAADTAVTERRVRSAAGRLVRIEFDAADKSQVSGAQRLGKNIPIQATSAEITKQAMVLLDARLDSDCRIVNSIHDELVVECPADRADDVRDVMQTAMIEGAGPFLKRAPVEVEIGVNEAWLK